MKKLMVAVGIVILVFGILLAAFTFIALPKNKTEAYKIPESTVIVDQFGLLGPFPTTFPTTDFAEGEFNFSAGELLNIQVNVTSGNKINFYVDDGSKGLNSNLDSTIYLSYPNVTIENRDWVVPKNTSYNFVFRSPNTFLANDVHWQIMKVWNETDYRSVTQNVPLFPFQLPYVGVAVALLGTAIAMYGIVAKNRNLSVRPFQTVGCSHLLISPKNKTVLVETGSKSTCRKN